MDHGYLPARGANGVPLASDGSLTKTLGFTLKWRAYAQKTVGIRPTTSYRSLKWPALPVMSEAT